MNVLEREKLKSWSLAVSELYRRTYVLNKGVCSEKEGSKGST